MSVEKEYILVEEVERKELSALPFPQSFMRQEMREQVPRGKSIPVPTNIKNIFIL